jgi:WD40 repeat protein
VLRSLVGGEDLVLVDCDHGFFANPHWLTGERLLLSGPSCWGCETDAVRFSIADLRTGRIQDLNPAPERGAAFAVSPDGSRLLISGDRLRLYSRDGALLRTIEAPPGFSVLGVAWSPDGSRFAYVVGPPFFTI